MNICITYIYANIHYKNCTHSALGKAKSSLERLNLSISLIIAGVLNEF